jgi:hypothetical protein
MKEGELRKDLKRLKNKSVGYLWLLVKDFGEEQGVKGLCPLQLRHTHYVNRARLGHNAFDISHGSGTSLNTIHQYYTVGMGQSKGLSEDDREFLAWLMEA